MKRETKDTILKVGLVLLYMIFFASFCVFLVGLLGGCSVYDWYKISEYLFMLVFPAGVVYFIFFFAWGGITEKKKNLINFPHDLIRMMILNVT